MAVPFMTGQGAVVQLFLDGGKFGDELDVESWDLMHDVEAVSDGVCGEGANRFDHIHIGWTLNLNLKLVTAEKVKAYLKYRDDIDAQSIPEQSVGMKLTPRGPGAAALFSLNECSIGGMGLSAGGRTNRLAMKLPMKARYMKPLN